MKRAMNYWILAILLIGAMFWFASSRMGSGQAYAEAATQAEPRLGGVRIVVDGDGSVATINDLVAAAKKAGWSEAKVEEPNSVTFIPPPNYRPEMFGKLLQSFEKTKRRNFGLQLLDSAGRPIGPDGRPVD